MAPIRAFRLLSGALMSALVIIGIALSAVVGNHNTGARAAHSPSSSVYLVIVVVGVAAAGMVQAVGYRLPALSPGLAEIEARKTGLQAYQRTMSLRFAISESVAIVAILLTFAQNSDSVLPYVLAAAISMALMAYHVWPSDSLIRRVQARLDRNGGSSRLADEMFGRI
jgi:hypothetical protein